MSHFWIIYAIKCRILCNIPCKRRKFQHSVYSIKRADCYQTVSGLSHPQSKTGGNGARLMQVNAADRVLGLHLNAVLVSPCLPYLSSRYGLYWPCLSQHRQLKEFLSTNEHESTNSTNERESTNYHELRPNFSGIRRYSCNSLTFILEFMMSCPSCQYSIPTIDYSRYSL